MNAAPAVPAPDSMLGDIAILRRKWRAALPPGATLPPYDEVALGSLGRMADHMLLVGGGSAAEFRVLRAGRQVSAWLGEEARDRRIDALPDACKGSLRQAVINALTTAQPHYATAHRVRDGMVESYALFALPLACRWSTPLVALYVRALGYRTNLVDAIFRASGEGTVALAALRDGDGRPYDFQIVTLNNGAAQLLRTGADALLWRRLSDTRLGAQDTGLMRRLLATLETGQADQFEFSPVVDGQDLHLQVGLASLGDLVSLTLTDISDIKQREASFRLLFDGNPVPMWLYDPERLSFIAVNEAAVAHYGYDRSRFQTMSLRDIWPREEWERHEAVARSVETAYQAEHIWRHLKADGRQIEVQTYATRLSFGGRPAVLVAVVDVTERRQAEARIAFMAHHDPLTGLANRVLFHERLDEALHRLGRHGGGLAVLCLDLDHFKGVNDTLGHPVGDELLEHVARRLAENVGEDDVVARLGGDEFAIIGTAMRGSEAPSALASRLIEVVSRPYEVHGHDVVIGASIGVALAPEDGDSADVLLRNADMALYRAKADGRGTFHFFEAEMDRKVQARRTLEINLRKALAQAEFELYFQPLVNLRSDRVSGFEALVRWRHPERGVISPAEFIPLAEETGLIVPLGEWVLRRACLEAASWPNDLHVAVNLSPVQFRSRALVQAVVSALGHARLRPSRLELEITESVLLGETDANLSILHQLRELGVRISMDDFGTGYSSLRYLRSFPFDKIKIDRSFVRDLAERPDCVAIVRAVTGLGASLGIATTAEGVETQAQLDMLRAEGCTEVQGYLFSPPRPAADIVGLMGDNAARQVDAA